MTEAPIVPIELTEASAPDTGPARVETNGQGGQHALKARDLYAEARAPLAAPEIPAPEPVLESTDDETAAEAARQADVAAAVAAQETADTAARSEPHA